MTDTDMLAELERLKAENAALKKAPEIKIKVSGKGGISIYGLQRFPVTLYKEQWEKILDRSDELRTFIEHHATELKGYGEEE